MNFYNQQGTNAWELKINYLKAPIELEAKDMWMEIDSLMN